MTQYQVYKRDAKNLQRILSTIRADYITADTITLPDGERVHIDKSSGKAVVTLLPYKATDGTLPA